MVLIWTSLMINMGFPDGSADKESAYSAGDTGNGFDPWVRKIPWSRKMASHSTILSWTLPWTEEPGGPQSVGLQTEWLMQTWMINDVGHLFVWLFYIYTYSLAKYPCMSFADFLITSHISRLHTISMIPDHWCWPWSLSWDSVYQVFPQ